MPVRKAKKPRRSTRSRKNAGFFDTFVRVLGVRDEHGWAAVALEMDLWGHGKTFDEAFADVMNLIRMQFAFAAQKDQSESAFNAAEPKFFELFQRVQDAHLRHFASSAEPEEAADDFRTRGLELPPAWAIGAAGKYSIANV